MARLDARDLGSWDQDVASLAGTLVHEVKNPLSTLNINTQLILEEWPHPTTPRETRMVKRLEVMRSEIGRIEQIVNSFLRLVREVEPAKSRTDLNGLLDDLVAHNVEGLERAGIRILFQPTDGVGEVEGDENLLRQAFLNLVRNAEQAMPDGGELMIRTQGGEGTVTVEVIDTGVGIAEDRLSRVFKPYFSSTPSGTGLGLPTTLRIVRQHGGHIVVESEVGKGSRFTVVLPRDHQSRELQTGHGD